MNKYIVKYRETWVQGFEREAIIEALSVEDIQRKLECNEFKLISDEEIDPSYLDTEIISIEEDE